MATAELLPGDAELLAWDWRATLKSQGRTIAWLAGATGRSARTLYAWGQQGWAPIAWRRAAARVLGIEVRT